MSEKKSEKIELPIQSMQSVAGSQFPLVILPVGDDNSSYNPFEHRKLEHPTT